MSLEALNGASSLVPGALPAVAASIAAAHVGQLAPAQPARDSSAIPATPVAHPRPTGEVRQPLPSRLPVEPAIIPLAATSAPTSGTSIIDARPQANAIAITAPLVTPAPTGGVAQPKTYGGAGVIRPMSLVLAPSAQPQQAATPQTNAAVVENTTNPTGGTSGVTTKSPSKCFDRRGGKHRWKPGGARRESPGN